jgi:acyl-coenzyme A thioesterase PaaI-like protein
MAMSKHAIQPANPAYAEVLQKAVLAMPMARELGLQFRRVAPGEVDLFIPYRDAWSFRPGQLQATAIFAAADFAAVAAAGTLLPSGWINASIDCTLKIVGPADGEALLARGRVVDAGRLLSVCAAEVFAVREGRETLCSTALATARNIEVRNQ